MNCVSMLRHSAIRNQGIYACETRATHTGHAPKCVNLDCDNQDRNDRQGHIFSEQQHYYWIVALCSSDVRRIVRIESSIKQMHEATYVCGDERSVLCREVRGC